ncbi:hypothetical protein KUCAC02_001275 [Chaenocephalus aceratus]|uniref:Uncharacterized protein n=1 Tax=Chaenocephalus aceratus TaxID=36190 RepID=A0ACB9XX37_CHAAC|nr:hypothetical protein KUCAC02_001275 [Chaenocephalus aceratus]
MQLNEIKPGLQYKLLSQTRAGPRARLRDDGGGHGQFFEGAGSTKKKAKLNAAEKALRSSSSSPTPLRPTWPWAGLCLSTRTSPRPGRLPDISY